MGRSSSPPSFSRLLFGLVVVGVGLLFTLQNLNWIDADRVLEWLSEHWPLVFVLIGFSKLFGSGRSWTGALLWISIGATLLAPQPIRDQVLDFAFRFWPLGLVLLGSIVVIRALRGGGGGKGRGALESAAEVEPRVSLFAFLASRHLRNSCPAFEGGDLIACLGGCELDLRSAGVEGEAVIEVFAFWGGVDIVVPGSWSVDLRAVPFMGGAEDNSRPPKIPTGERVVIKGIAFMGGISIRN